jgi:hypothetical protein
MPIRNPLWAPEFTGQKPSLNTMGAFRLNRNHPLTKGLQLWFLINEGAGNILYDIVRGHQLAMVGTVTRGVDVKGPNIGGFSTSNYYSGTVPILISASTYPFTLGALGYIVSDPGTDSYMVSMSDDSTGNFVTVGMEGNVAGDPAYTSHRGGGSSIGEIYASNSNTIPGWTHAVQVVRGASSRSLYSNGIRTDNVATTTGTLTTLTRFSIGLRKLASVAKPWSGNILQVYLWNRELSDQEVTSLYLNPFGTPDNPRFIVEPQRIWFVPVVTGGASTPLSVTGSLTPVGTIIRSSLKPYVSGITPVGSIDKSLGKSVTGELTPVGSISKESPRPYSGTLIPLGSISKSDAKAYSGTVTPEGTLSKVGTFLRSLGGTLTPNGAIAFVKTLHQSLSGAITPVGEIIKSVAKNLAGTIASYSARVGHVAVVTYQYFVGVISMHSTRTPYPTGASYNISFSGLLTPVGTVVKQFGKTLLGYITPSSSGVTEVLKNYILGISGTLTPVGTFVKCSLRAFSGVLGSIGDLVANKVTGLTLLALSGVIQPAGSLLKQVSKSISSEILLYRNFARGFSFARSFDGTIDLAGTLSNLTATLLIVYGSIVPNGTLVKSVGKSLAGILTPIGTVAKSIGRLFTGVIDFLGNLLISWFITPSPTDLGEILYVASANLSMTVEAENRTMTVLAENRTLIVPPNKSV